MAASIIDRERQREMGNWSTRETAAALAVAGEDVARPGRAGATPG